LPEHLKEFFAVTMNSVYKVAAYGEDDCPYAEKIAASKNGGSIKLGDRIDNAPMMAIARRLQFYYPESHSIISPVMGEERRLEHVNTAWWRGGTSSIVALFLKEKGAMYCFEQKNLKPCDKRWVDKTKEVMKKVGDEHPNVTICSWPGLCLIPF